MLRLIASEEAIAFVGAGLSASLYPPWQALLDKLRLAANEAGKFEPTAEVENDPLAFAEAIQRHFREVDGNLSQYFQTLAAEFALSDQGCTTTHTALVCLPFKGYVTTNYDQSLETALLRAGNTRPDCSVVVKRDNRDAHKISEFLLSLDDRSQNQRVAHLHGRESETEDIILSTSDYETAYGFRQTGTDQISAPVQKEWTLHRKLVWALLATRRVIFFGFSFSDPYITRILRDVAADLWSKGAPRHFALAPLDEAIAGSVSTRERQFLEYGVRLVFYDNAADGHSALKAMIEDAAARFGNPSFPRFRSLQAAKRKPREADPLTEQKAPKIPWWRRVWKRQVAINQAPGLQWLDDVNSDTARDLQNE